MQEKWAKIQSILVNSLDSGQMRAWVANLVPSWEEGALVLCAQTEFAAAHVRSWFLPVIASAVREVCGADCGVRVECRPWPGGERALLSGNASVPAFSSFVSGPEGFSKGVARPAADAGGCAPGMFAGREVTPGGAAVIQGTQGIMQDGDKGLLDSAQVLPSPRPLPLTQLTLPLTVKKAQAAACDTVWRYSFEDFVVGPCNELAYAASRSICGENTQADVLFLSSAPGLGKTHLMHAVGKVLCSVCNRSQPKVEYLTAEEFVSRFYFSLKNQDADRFKARHRKLDLLLLEDVHFFQGKEKMQAELLATVKALRDSGGKIVFSSSFMPRDLKQIDEQLQSRFSAGFLTVIERPDEETRRRILRRKASLHQVLLPDDVEDVLARHIHADVRQLESCLQNLILKARLLNSRITMQMALELLCNYAEQTPVLDMESIIAFVCRGYGLSGEQLFSSSRKQEYVLARNTAFYLARKHTDLSLESIGRRFNRKHSTVIKGITNLEREISCGSPLGRQIANTLAMIERNGNILAPGSQSMV